MANTKDGPSRRAWARAGRALEKLERLLLRVRRFEDALAIAEEETKALGFKKTIFLAHDEIAARVFRPAKTKRSTEKHLHWLGLVQDILRRSNKIGRLLERRRIWRLRVQLGDSLRSKLARVPNIAYANWYVTDRAKSAHPAGETTFAPRVEIQARGPRDPSDLFFEEEGGRGLVLKMGEAVQNVLKWTRWAPVRGRLRFTVHAELSEELRRYMQSPRLIQGSRPEIGWSKSVIKTGVFLPRWYEIHRSTPAAITQAINRIASLEHAGVNVTRVTLDINLGAFRAPKA